jgi:hypothetical protein
MKNIALHRRLNIIVLNWPLWVVYCMSLTYQRCVGAKVRTLGREKGQYQKYRSLNNEILYTRKLFSKSIELKLKVNLKIIVYLPN